MLSDVLEIFINLGSLGVCKEEVEDDVEQTEQIDDVIDYQETESEILPALSSGEYVTHNKMRFTYKGR